MKVILTFIVLITTAVVGYSQDDSKGVIDPQRPSLSESYSIVIPNIIQFENGFDYLDNSGKVSSGTFVRGAVARRVELRVFTDYSHLNTAGLKFIVMERRLGD